jgi:hypothetical protein
MKLPEGRKERTQVLVLILIGLVGMLFVIVQFGVLPLRASLTSKRERLQELRDKIDGADRFITQMSRHERRNADLIQQLANLSTNYFLQDEVGNYLLPATAIVRRHAETAGIEEVEVGQIGFGIVPQPKDSREERPFKFYTVRATMQTPYANAIAFLDGLLAANPFVSVSGVQIAPQQGQPLAHSVVMDVQWPIWADKEAEREILESAQKQATGEDT